MRTKLYEIANRARSAEDFEVSGRVVSVRKHKNISFVDLNDESGNFQCVIKDDLYGQNPVKKGDILRAKTKIGKSNSGQPSLYFLEYSILVSPTEPNHKPDLQLAELIKDRARLEDSVRSFFKENGLTQVDAPYLTAFSGTSNIVPFRTTYRGGKDYYLRFTMELEMKKLIAETQMPLFEIGKVFKNMGESGKRAFEYKVCEAYLPYTSLDQGTALVDKLFRGLARNFDFKISEIQKKTVGQAFEELTGKKFVKDADMKELFKKQVKKMESLLYLSNPPTEWTSPLYETNTDGTSQDTRLIKGSLGTLIQVCGESNDYEKVYGSLLVQKEKLAKEGRKSELDLTFIKSLKSGIPPCVGIHIGMDRLLMLFKGSKNISKVLI